jgi:hypothetical protein
MRGWMFFGASEIVITIPNDRDRNNPHDASCPQNSTPRVMKYRDGIKLKVVRPGEFRSDYVISPRKHLQN